MSTTATTATAATAAAAEDSAPVPNWLLRLEEQREKRLRARLGHETGAGAPCQNCKCSGLDLHFWRKICKVCKCKKEDHDINEEDIYGFVQFQLLGDKPSKAKSFFLNGHKDAVVLDWTPKGSSNDVKRYLDELPADLLPVKGSEAAKLRKQRLQKQMPAHDIDASLCHALTEDEIKELEEYVAHIRKHSVGQGKVIQLSLLKAQKHQMPHPNTQFLTQHTPGQLASSQPVCLHPADLANNLHNLMLQKPKNQNRLEFLNSQIPQGAADADESRNYRPESGANIQPKESRESQVSGRPFGSQLTPKKDSGVVTDVQQPVSVGGNVKDVRYGTQPAVSMGNVHDSYPDATENVNRLICQRQANYVPKQLHQVVDNQEPVAIYPGDTNKNPYEWPGYPGNVPNAPNQQPINYPLTTSNVEKHQEQFENPSLLNANVRLPQVLGQYAPNFLAPQEEERVPYVPSAGGFVSYRPSQLATHPTEDVATPNANTGFARDDFAGDNYQKEGGTRGFDPQTGHRDTYYASEGGQLPDNYKLLKEQHDKQFAQIDPRYAQSDPRYAQNDPRANKIDRNDPSLTQNDPRFTKNDSNSSQNDPRFGQNDKNDPRFDKSDPRFGLYDRNDPRYNTNDPKHPRCDPNDPHPNKNVRFGPNNTYYDPNDPLYDPNDPRYDLNDPHSNRHDRFGPNDPGTEPTDLVPPHEPPNPKTKTILYAQNTVNPVEQPQSLASVGYLRDIEYPAGQVPDAGEAGAPGGAAPACHRCSQTFGEDAIAISAERTSALWHAACFTCRTCSQPLADLMYFYHRDLDDVYCGRDYAILRGIPRCAACDELIFVREYCLAEERTFHVKHFCCFECDEPLAGSQYVMEEGGQPVCLPCYEQLMADRCHDCGYIISAEQRGVSLQGLHWHAQLDCFACKHCRRPLLNGKVLLRAQNLFCSDACFRAYH